MEEIPAEQRIYLVLAAIPAGNVTSYGRVAALAGLGRGARQVGRTLKNLPKDSSLPWHRVLRSDGKIAFPPESEAFQRQQHLLEKDGVEVSAGRVNLRQFAWDP